MNNNFYCYAHTKPNGDIFYIGKGKDNRAYESYGRTSYWSDIAKNCDYSVVILADKLNEFDAYNYEKELIKHFKKFNKLVNIIHGGGAIYYVHPNKGKKTSQEIKDKISNILTGRKLNEKHRKKLAISNKNYNPDRYIKSSLSNSKGIYKTPNGNFHSLRLASIANNCSAMTVKNRCLGYIAKKHDKMYAVTAKAGWLYIPYDKITQ